MEKLVIKKRTAGEIACWKVDAQGVCPNTVIELDPGITLLINVEGQNKTTSKSAVTINSLINPGKNTKLIGGKKPYSKCEIYAVDITSEFKSEWGLAGPSAIPCYDSEFEVDAKAVCFGEYFYSIDDYFAFVRCLPMSDKDEMSRTDVREFLRSQTTGIARSYFSSKLMGRDIKECQGKLGEYAEDIKDQLNRHFDSKGITLHSFLISNLDFEPAHKVNRDKLKDAKINVKIKGVENEGRRDDISVDKAESEIEIGLINARNGNSQANGGKSSGKVICSRCKEPNDANDNYCAKCGEKLTK